MDNRSDTEFIGTEHKAKGNGDKPAEGGLPGETGFKTA